MRRAPIILTATVLGTAGVLLFKPMSTTALAGSAAGTGLGTSSTTSGTGGSEPASSAAAPSASSAPSSSAKASSGTSSSGGKDGTFTGAPETTRFGTTQVKVTIAGSKITDVTPVQLNQNDPRSMAISQTAAPMVRTEVLAKQSAEVDNISGATYTTAAYEASLQSALDKAGYVAPDGSKASTDVSNIQESGGFGH